MATLGVNNATSVTEQSTGRDTDRLFARRPERVRQRTVWRPAVLLDSRLETRNAKTLEFAVAGWHDHVAGQHLDVRLRAPDGYTAQRSYSLASAPGGRNIELTVQRVLAGEVSPYLVDTLAIGDTLEIRGPLGGWFRWSPDLQGPTLLVGGGSGVVPLMAMVRHRARTIAGPPMTLLYSTRTPDHVFYATELFRIGRDHPFIHVRLVHSRSALPDDPRGAARLGPEDFPEADSTNPSHVFVCGPNGFVEATVGHLVARGHDPSRIKTERFGPTGG